jgi:hypothetical protein
VMLGFAVMRWPRVTPGNFSHGGDMILELSQRNIAPRSIVHP